MPKHHNQARPRHHAPRGSSSWILALRKTAALAALLLVSCQGVSEPDEGESAENGGDSTTDPNKGCLAECSGRECGDDGCGGICGTCADGIACNPVAGNCAVLCGNAVLDPEETCDPPGSCVTSCEDDGDACTRETLVGTAESCSSTCESSPITECTSGDGCCAAGCNAANDTDCKAVCGNAVAEPGETCGDVGAACPTTCDDGDFCTEDILVGSTETCDAACEFNPIDPCTLDQARGVTVGNISTDQGIRVQIREEGKLINAENYNGALIPERSMLVRADWEVADSSSFITRDIRAVLTVEHQNKSSETVEDVKEVSPINEPSYEDFNEAFVFTLAPEQVTQGMRLSIELYEEDESYRSQPAPTTPARFPEEADTTFDLGVNADPSHVEIVIVPFYHDIGEDCPAPPDFDAMTDLGGQDVTWKEFYRQRFVAQNPVSDATIIVHDLIHFTGSTEEGAVFTRVSQARYEDDAPDWQFYYGLIAPCDDGPGYAGLSSRPGHGSDGLPDKSDGRSRIGYGRWRPDFSVAETFVHEIGHQQGRQHVAGCANPSGPDGDYPNNTGDIEVFGWNVFSADEIHPPDDKDYMSYCGSSWVSEYAWNLMEPWIAEMSLWPNQEQFTTEARTPMLFATITPGKPAQWWSAKHRGDPKLETSNHVIHFYAEGKLLSSSVAEYKQLPELPGVYFLEALLPESWAKVTHLVYNDGDSLEEVERSSVLTVN